MVLSIISVVSSTMSCSISDLNTFSHTPCFVHRLKRLYTLLHGPNLSGKSRHGIPVFSQYIMPFSITRLSFAGRPPRGFLSAGSIPIIFSHFSSLISCILITLLYHFIRNFATLFLVCKHSLAETLFTPSARIPSQPAGDGY